MTKNRGKNRVTFASNLLIFIGVGIIIAALIYMIGNLHRADSLIKMWVPFMIAGVWLTFLGGVLGFGNSEKPLRKNVIGFQN